MRGLRGPVCVVGQTPRAVAGEFVGFVETRGGLSRLDAGVLDAFVATFVNSCLSAREAARCFRVTVA